MLRQDMQQTQETLAARTAEVDELKTRVAELEKLQQQQQQLISLKDTELAAAQQRLTVSNQQPVPALSSTEASADAGASGTWIWLVLGLALIGAAIVGWLLMRRQAQVRPAPSFRTSALAQGMPGSSSASALAASHGDAFQRADVGTPAEDSQTDPVASGDRADDTDVEAEATVTGREPSDPAVWNPPAAGSVEIATPTWHAGDRVAKPAADPARPQHEANSTGSASTGADSDRIELARAYLDLGDADTARTLLQEVVEDGDVMAGDEARRMLRDLG